MSATTKTAVKASLHTASEKTTKLGRQVEFSTKEQAKLNIVSFWGPTHTNGWFSNHYRNRAHTFTVSDVDLESLKDTDIAQCFAAVSKTAHLFTFDCRERLIMALKAAKFHDEKSLKTLLYDRKLTAGQVMQIGRQVTNYKDDKWSEIRSKVAEFAIRAQFTQHLYLLDLLMSTDGATMVEASEKDRIWGIGMGPRDPRVASTAVWDSTQNIYEWTSSGGGTNLLGQAFMRVRDELRIRPS